ncbi:helix-turn-helix domain-containing protein [Gemmiger sp.]
MDVIPNMLLFSELIQCGGNVYTWCYDADGTLLKSNCPDEAFLSGAFDLFGCKRRMLEYGREHTTPVGLGTALGMIWAAAFEKEDGALKRAWVIGPVFYQDVSLRGIEQGLQYYGRLETSIAWTMQLYEVIKKVPVLQSTILNRYTLMLHYCLTGEHLTISDINNQPLPEVANAAQAPDHDRHKVYMAERAMLQMVRTGDLNYKQALSASFGISAGVPVHSDDALRQSKTSIIVFISLVCRAAIEGGLSPEEAYALGDDYIQTTESAKTLDDLNPLPMMMYDDFIRRVHKCRTNPKLSMQVQKCVDYIEMHLEEKIRAADLATLVGYTEYYLTHKFKEETGLSVTDYAKFAKIERAKVLLKSTDMTVQDIAASLAFNTRNYFSRIFQEVTGQTPMEYRED